MKFVLKDGSSNRESNGSYVRVLSLAVTLTTDSPNNARVFEGDNEEYCKGMAAMLSILHGEKYVPHFIK